MSTKTILRQEHTNVDKFKELIKKDPKIARVWLSNNEVLSYTEYFTDNGSNFVISSVETNYGISITNKLYANHTTLKSIIVKNNTFYVKYRNSIQALSYSHLNSMNKAWQTILFERHPWIKFVCENKIPIIFNTIYRKKLFSFEDCVKYLYKTNYPTAKKLHNVFYDSGVIKFYKRALPYLYNLENFNFELLENNMYSLFQDSIKMAKLLQKKINCAWSTKRLTQEHDNWAKEITDILANIDNQPLTIDKQYLDFNEYFGGGLLTESKDLVKEGYSQGNCVASYISKVNSGKCAIFHVNGHTVELGKLYNVNSNPKLYLAQIKSKYNGKADIEIERKIQSALILFNENN